MENHSWLVRGDQALKPKSMDGSSLPSADGNKKKKKKYIFFPPKAGTSTMGRNTLTLPWRLQAGCALAQEEEGKKYVQPVLVSLGKDVQVSHAILHRSPPWPQHHRNLEHLGCCHERSKPTFLIAMSPATTYSEDSHYFYLCCTSEKPLYML